MTTITLAGLEYELLPHKGESGREQDMELLKFVGELQASGQSELLYFSSHPKQFEAVCRSLLDVNTEERLTAYNELTLFDLIPLFQEGVAFRTGDLESKKTKKALKN